MSASVFLTISQQVAAHLREEIFRGRWQGSIPGLPSLAKELEVNRKTVEAALRLLESEGLLVSQGAGKRRKIVLPESGNTPGLRVALLSFDVATKTEHYIVDLQHQLKEAGHRAEYTSRTLLELGMDVSKVARLVDQTKADAWVICSGSREILAWFAAQSVPAFALFGRRRTVPIAAAGPDKSLALADAVRRLVVLGHRRIVLMVREEIRKPRPSNVVQKAFLDELETHGITPGPYNLPDWEQTPSGYRDALESLFKVTQPTALILDEVWQVVPTLQFCLSRGIQIPRDLSLVSGDPDPSFDWSVPPISHIRWDPAPVVRRVVRWVNAVAIGRLDLRQTLTHAEFVPGGTIGPAK